MKKFVEHDIRTASLPNPFSMIGQQWMLVTAGDKDGYNMMTASWGQVGVLWGKQVATIYIRPQRYTKEFVDKNDTFTLSFFDDAYRPALNFCGTKSGRDYHKAEETGLTPVFSKDGVYFEEASFVLVCKKLYQQPVDPSCFLDRSIEGNYPGKDYHDMYIGEIIGYLVRQD